MKSNKIFLVDCLGAIISAILYLIVLPKFETLIGMPKNILFGLGLIAIIYALFSGFCYLKKLSDWRLFLKIISTANIMHCLLVIALLFFYKEQITYVGTAYFIGEIIIVLSLAIFEYKMVKPTNN